MTLSVVLLAITPSPASNPTPTSRNGQSPKLSALVPPIQPYSPIFALVAPTGRRFHSRCRPHTPASLTSPAWKVQPSGRSRFLTRSSLQIIASSAGFTDSVDEFAKPASRGGLRFLALQAVLLRLLVYV